MRKPFTERERAIHYKRPPRDAGGQLKPLRKRRSKRALERRHERTLRRAGRENEL